MVDPAALIAQDTANRQAAAAAVIAGRLQLMADRWFTPEHTWMAIDGQTATIGITDHATRMIMDVLFVSLPGIGASLSAGEACGQVEASGAVFDLRAPVGGTVAEINKRLDAEPELAYLQPYGEGWMFRLRVSPDTAASLRVSMLSPAEYEEFTRPGKGRAG